MTPQALTALKESIAHWERVATGNRKPGEIAGRRSCALCSEFNNDKMDFGFCHGCPVMERTKFAFCQNTPWELIEPLISWPFQQDQLDTPEARDLAAKELAFLKSLLPEDGK